MLVIVMSQVRRINQVPWTGIYLVKIMNPSKAFRPQCLSRALRGTKQRVLSTYLKSVPRDKVAIRHTDSGTSYTYQELIDDVSRWQTEISRLTQQRPTRVAIAAENSFQFMTAFLACLCVENAAAVPLCTRHTTAETAYALSDSETEFLITPRRFVSRLEPATSTSRVKVLVYEDHFPSLKSGPEPQFASSSAHILYTSGTSGRPKGVITPIDAFRAQARSLTEVWKFSADTSLLHVLPLHHVHGLLIAATMPILAGGRVEFAFPFEPETVYQRLDNNKLPPINTFTAVPTIYTRLVEFGEKADNVQGLKNLKLAMCGSSALPDSLRESWDALTEGKVPLLERYGMTETGITLSQPLEPSARQAGSVGLPVPGVEVRLMDEDGDIVYSCDSKNSSRSAFFEDSELQGEIEVRGPLIFKEYYNQRDKTEEAFSASEWFKTGDIARVQDKGNLFIQGRASMDIIKSGGEKLSALEIEREILSESNIEECAVVGVPSRSWGEEVAAVIKLKEADDSFTLSKLRASLEPRISKFKLPRRLQIVDKIPRNQMGKVNKKKLARLFADKKAKQ